MSDELKVVRPDGISGVSKVNEEIQKSNVLKVDDIKVSDDFVRHLMSKTSFIEGLKAVDINFNNDEVQSLKYEVSSLKAEVSELKQKLEEK